MRFKTWTALAIGIAAALIMQIQAANAAPCLIVTITGAGGGPPNFGGVAGPGTLVRYGDDSNQCGTVKMQFDAGRATSMRLSQLDVAPGDLHVLFFTHMHSDHVDGFADLLQLRWHYTPKGPPLDVVCSADAAAPQGHMISCTKLAAHVADAYVQSGEIAQRAFEDKSRPPRGPAQLTRVMTFDPGQEPRVVWSSGDVKVSAIRSAHIAGHASYRVDTPAGSVVIGGDAGNDVPAPPRASSTSDQVESIAMGADVIVHSTIHPIMAPDKGAGMPAAFYFRQSTASDLGALAKRTGARHLVLTHLIPPVGAERQGLYKIPGGALTSADYVKAAQDGGFTGNTVVATDLASIRLPGK